jgi:hypothetical protein
MPKIVVREFDKTTAVGAPYSNFAVVVPGFAKTGATCFDENGIYECKSKDDFKENVTLISPTDNVVTPAAAPTFSTG